MKGFWKEEILNNFYLCYIDSLEFSITVDENELHGRYTEIDFFDSYDFKTRKIGNKDHSGEYISYGKVAPKFMKLSFDLVDKDKFQLFRPWPNESFLFCRIYDLPQDIKEKFRSMGCVQ